jgi:hypothetical protein
MSLSLTFVLPLLYGEARAPGRLVLLVHRSSICRQRVNFVEARLDKQGRLFIRLRFSFLVLD